MGRLPPRAQPNRDTVLGHPESTPNDATAPGILEKEEIRRIEREHAELLDISSDAIFVWQLDGAIQYWNKGAAELYGFSSDEAVGRSSHELLSTFHTDGLHNVIEELRRNRLWRGELTHRTKTRAVLTVQSSMQVVVRGDRISSITTAGPIGT